MHNLDNFFVQLTNAVINVWKARSNGSGFGMFRDPEERRRSRIWLTVLAVMVTLGAIAVAAVVIYMLWWAFTSDERHPR